MNKLSKQLGFDNVSQLEDIKKGKVNLDSTKYKGNFGEINMDDIYENTKGLERISKDRITGLDDKIKQGIDGVYEDPTGGPPKFIIGESKYGSSQLSTLTDGTQQMSEEWVKNRLIEAVGIDKANEIFKELLVNPDNVQFTIFRTIDSNGNYIEQILDKNGKIMK